MAGYVQEVFHLTTETASQSAVASIANTALALTPTTTGAFTNALATIAPTEPVRAYLDNLSLQVWNSTEFGLPDSLAEILKPALEKLQPTLDYIAEHPWVLIAVAPPAIEAMIWIIGFEAGGIAAGSIAAAVQSWIGNVPKGSLFSFLQSYGMRPFARNAIRMGMVGLVVAVVLAAVGMALVESGIKLSDVENALGKVFHTCMPKIDPSFPLPEPPRKEPVHGPSAGVATTAFGWGWWALWAFVWAIVA